jgi:Bacterial Ig-like domain (group 2)
MSVDSLSLAGAGATTTLSATARTATGPAAGASFTWSATDSTVARISGVGGSVTVVAVSAGRTTITVTSGGVSRTIPVTVTTVAPQVPSLKWSILRGRPGTGAVFGARVVLHERDTVLFSADSGTTWRRIPVPGDLDPGFAFHTGTHFVLLGNEGGALSSPDGESWSLAPAAPTTTSWYAGTVVGGQLLVVSDAGPTVNEFFTWVTTDGLTWERRGELDSSVHWLVQAGTRLYAGLTGVTYASADTGRTWTTVSSLFRGGRRFSAVAWDGRQLAEWDGDTLRTSDDGIVWRAVGTTIRWLNPRPARDSLIRLNDLEFQGGRYIAAGARADTAAFNTLEGTILESTDGVTWTEVDVERASVAQLIRLPGAWMSVGEAASWSRDGRSWENRLFNNFPRVDEIFWSSGRFYVAAFNSEYLRESTDGIRWREFALPRGFNFTFGGGGGVVWTGSAYVIAGADGEVFTSPDGIDWTQRATPTTNGIEELVQGGGVLVARSFQELLSSTDGVVWSSVARASAGAFTSVVRIGSRFVAVEQTGTGTQARTSTDGRTWTPGGDILGVASGRLAEVGGLLLHLSSGGQVSQSTDGTTWSLRGLWDPTNAPTLARDESASTYGTLLVDCSRPDLAGLSSNLVFSADGRSWVAGVGPTGSRRLCRRAVGGGSVVLYEDEDSGDLFVGRP